MKRVFGYVLLVLGLMFVFLGPLLRFYAVPRLEKAPTDVDNTVVSDGSGRYFSAELLQLVGPVPLQSVERFKGDTGASTHDVVVIDYQQHLVDLQSGREVDYDKEVFAMDRKSGFAVNCCGDKPEHSGLEVKFPFGTEKTEYQLWDSSSDKPFPAKYVATEEIDGTTVYHFHQDIPPQTLGFLNIPGPVVGQPPGNVNVARMYQASVEIWVEPTTGAIVKGSKHAQQWAADTDGTRLAVLADLTVTYSPDTVDTLLDDAVTGKKQLGLIKNVMPIALPILGIVLALLGVFLLRRPKAAKPVEAPAATAAA